MEDREVLEEILNRKIEDTEGTKRMKQAIENLISRNKKLEELLDEDLGNIINLGILLSEHAEKPKDKNIYIDEVQDFLNTLDYYYIPKSKVREKMKKDEWAYKSYDSSIADYRQSQAIGRYMACLELLQEGDK